MRFVRDCAALEATRFDLLIVGGGIVGAGICHEAALRGLKVALIEQKDFASATTSACFRILHGGVRYLQHLNFKRLLQSVNEQRVLRTIAEDFTAPLPFLVPAYGLGMKGRAALTAGLNLYQLLARDRNKGVSDQVQLPGFKTLSLAETLDLAPHLDQTGLSGAVVYHDAQIKSCERLTLALLKAAAERGAVIANYVRADSSESRNGQLESVLAEDLQSGGTFRITAAMHVFATGPWSVSERLLPDRAPSAPRRYSRQIQLVVPNLNRCGTAIAAQSNERDSRAKISRGGRAFFFVPYRGMTLIGTSEEEWSGDPAEFKIGQTDARAFLAQAAAAYPDKLLCEENIKYAWGGLMPLREETGAVGEEPRIFDSPQDLGVSNALIVEAVKFSTFRALSEITIERVCRRMNLNFEPGLSTHQILSEDLPGSLPEQVEHAVNSEMALNLSDVVFRRLPQGTLGAPDPESLRLICEKMSALRGWGETERRAQEDALRLDFQRHAISL